jgi:hypothetical protein
MEKTSHRVDAETGEILASELTTSDADDGLQIEHFPHPITGPLASLVGAGACNLASIDSSVI